MDNIKEVISRLIVDIDFKKMFEYATISDSRKYQYITSSVLWMARNGDPIYISMTANMLRIEPVQKLQIMQWLQTFFVSLVLIRYYAGVTFGEKRSCIGICWFKLGSWATHRQRMLIWSFNLLYGHTHFRHLLLARSHRLQFCESGMFRSIKRTS